MMKTISSLTLLYIIVVLIFMQSSYGDFITILVDDISNNNDGLREYAVYAVFDDPDDILTASVKSSIESTTGFFHNTLKWEYQSIFPLPEAALKISDNPDVDSFVTIGFWAIDGNFIAPADFCMECFFFGNTLGEGASWWTTLSDSEGIPDEGGKVLIAVLAPLNEPGGAAGIVSGTVGFIYRDAQDGLTEIDPVFFTTKGVEPPAPGDLNNDGVVDGADLGLLLNAWGACPNPVHCPSDLNNDGTVDGVDLGILLSYWSSP